MRLASHAQMKNNSKLIADHPSLCSLREFCVVSECASNKHTATHVTHKNTLRMERDRSKKKRLKGGAREKTKRHL
jgi:hypothetical protein